MAYRYQPETHGVQPVYDPALDDGGGIGPQLQGYGTGAPDGRYSSNYYESNGIMHQNSLGLPSTTLLDPYFISSPPHETQVPTNAIQNNLPFDPYSGLPFLPNDNSFATQASYPPLYHHRNQYPLPNEEPLSMHLHHRADPTWLTTNSSGPSMREGNHWESVSPSDNFYGDSNHLDDFTLVPAPVHLPYGSSAHQLSSISHSPFQNGQIQNLPNHTSTLFDFEGNPTPSHVVLSQFQVMSVDRGDTEQETASRLNNYTSANIYTSSNGIPISQANRPMELPFSSSASTHQTKNSRSIDDSSHGSSSSRSGIRTRLSPPSVSGRKRKKSSGAVGSNTKSKRPSEQCHIRPLRPDQIDQVQNDLRPWFHNQLRYDPIPPELYSGMFKMIDGKEFCAIRGCKFESTPSKRRPGLKHEHANRHLHHKPFYCLACKKGYGRKEDHGLHPLILASSLPTNPYLSVPNLPITHTTNSETPHTLLA